MTNPNLDDVKALAERHRKIHEGPHAEGFGSLFKDTADMLDRLASQREDVIDREAIARILRENIHIKQFMASTEIVGWAKAADAIIRSLPSREAIIEGEGK